MKRECARKLTTVILIVTALLLLVTMLAPIPDLQLTSAETREAGCGALQHCLSLAR
ncbi:MAG: hypothetical protein IKS42_10740 [Oscillospiraceae bacterium]|nr:hypothetical protein [Oscillospiraceae bacterium]